MERRQYASLAFWASARKKDFSWPEADGQLSEEQLQQVNLLPLIVEIRPREEQTDSFKTEQAA